MPTLQEVAQRAGVSTATVSKVLSNTPYFTEETRDKVMKAVNELNYVPNLAGRALSSGKTHVIAVVFPYIYDTLFSDPLVLYILEGVEAECREHGYNMLLSTPRLTDQGVDEQYLRLVQSGYLDGIVALDNVPIASVLESARKKGIPAVAIGYHEHPYYVRSDDTQGGYLLMQHILSLGHRHIGLIGVDDHLLFSMSQRSEGLQQAAREHGLDIQHMVRGNGDYSVESGAACAAHMLKNHPELTALICLNDRMALGAIQQAQLLGRKVPDDLSIVGYDDIPMSHFISPALTTINQHAPDLGRAATKMLFELLNNELPDSVVLPTELVVRQSSGRVNSPLSSIV
jgi:LacI family transcriptional regulator